MHARLVAYLVIISLVGAHSAADDSKKPVQQEADWTALTNTMNNTLRSKIENEIEEIGGLIEHMDNSLAGKIQKRESELDAALEERMSKIVEAFKKRESEMDSKIHDIAENFSNISLPKVMNNLTEILENGLRDRVKGVVEHLVKDAETALKESGGGGGHVTAASDNVTSAEIFGALAKRALNLLNDDVRTEERVPVASYFFYEAKNCTTACVFRRLRMKKDPNRFCNSRLIGENFTTAVMPNALPRDNSTSFRKISEMKITKTSSFGDSYYCEFVELRSNCSPADRDETVCERFNDTKGPTSPNIEGGSCGTSSTWLRTTIDLLNLAVIAAFGSLVSYGYLGKRYNKGGSSQQKALLKNENRRFTALHQ